jgi:hypothetical protein
MFERFLLQGEDGGTAGGGGSESGEEGISSTGVGTGGGTC